MPHPLDDDRPRHRRDSRTSGNRGARHCRRVPDPTGRIKCQLVSNLTPGAQSVRCTAIGSTAKLSKRPATCDFDWEDIDVSAAGRSFTVSTGDSIQGNFSVLGYSAAWKRGVSTCTSAKSGVTWPQPKPTGIPHQQDKAHVPLSART